MRAGEELPHERLAEWLGAPVEAEQFPTGHSNLTYLLRVSGEEFVLRRPPVGPVPPKAHDMVRESRILTALHPHFALAPRVFRVCEDASVIGAPFYLMERRHGVLFRGGVPVEYAAMAGYAARASAAVVECLARLHAVDVRAHGLIAFGKPAGFVERQVRGWTERWRAACVEPSAEMDRVLEALAATVPASGEPAMVHNDFKMDNLMFAPEDPGCVTAVLDWEMAAVGDPLADLGLALCYWLHADPAVSGRPAGAGWYTREEFVRDYAGRTGRDVSAAGWHEVLGVAKLAVILEQIYHRFVKGQTRDARFAGLGGQARALIATAARLKETYGL